MVDDPLGKTKYYATRMEFQERSSWHSHLFISVFSAAIIQNQHFWINFIEKARNAQFWDHLNNPKLFELAKTCQVYAYSRTSCKYNKNEFWLYHGWCFTANKITAKTTDFNCSNYEKHDVLTWKNTLLKQVKSCIGYNLNSTDVNMTDTTKGNLLSY